VSGFVVKKGTTMKIFGQLLANKKKHYGLIFRNVTDGDYTLTVEQRNSAPETETSDFTIADRPAVPAAPVVLDPTAAMELSFEFYPYGIGTENITDVTFKDSSGSPSVSGTVNEQPSAGNGNFWYATVTAPETWPTGPNTDYTLEVTNRTGTTPVPGLKLLTPP
jgi:hypothetical protein